MPSSISHPAHNTTQYPTNPQPLVPLCGVEPKDFLSSTTAVYIRNAHMHEEKSAELIAEHTARLQQLKVLLGCRICETREPAALNWYPDFGEGPEDTVKWAASWRTIAGTAINCELSCTACRAKTLAQRSREAASITRLNAQLAERTRRGLSNW